MTTTPFIWRPMHSPTSSRALDKREYLVIIREIFLLTLHKTICCDPSSEPSHRDGSDEGSQHMVSMRNKKNYHQILLII